MKILGVDPDIHGGLAIIELNNGTAPQLIDAIDIPVTGVKAKERGDILAIRTWVMTYQPQHAFIERAQAMPKQGASSGFKYGRAVRGSDKETSRQRALQLFSAASSRGEKIMDEQKPW